MKLQHVGLLPRHVQVLQAGPAQVQVCLHLVVRAAVDAVAPEQVACVPVSGAYQIDRHPRNTAPVHTGLKGAVHHLPVPGVPLGHLDVRLVLQPLNLVLGQALVKGHHHSGVVAASLAGAGQTGHHVAQATHLGNGRHLRRDVHNVHGGAVPLSGQDRARGGRQGGHGFGAGGAVPELGFIGAGPGNAIAQGVLQRLDRCLHGYCCS
mmetsp:Transcript_19213/g.41513  ORF Transcript_19213/g.41513 Transcript_19213/m.41513 type:complete len:207 (-) Transcript_19213:355-975(-)